MMNDEQISEPNEQAGAPKLDDGATQAQAQLSEFVASARQASENAKASEADAKSVLSQINQILAEAKGELGKISEAKPKFAEAASEVELKRSAVATAATEVETKRSAVATHAQQVDDAQKRAADIRAELDGVLATVKQTQGDIDGIKQSAEGAKDAASQANTDAQAAKAAVEANASAVANALKESKTASATTKGLADKAETIGERITDYEAKLNELKEQCDRQLEAIKSLLPGATSAGLASAFDQRRQTFLKPSTRWQWLFVGSVVFLAVIALLSLYQVYKSPTPMTLQELLVHWLSRVPFAASLVWLAMHASRESALAKRLEEDYGFKASVASSFQGFQEQMKNIGNLASGNEPLKTLCDATLAQITDPPGRIYDKHALVVSPTIEMLRLAKAMVDAAKAAKIPIDVK